MANIRPFKGLRALPELVKQISALPYDVMDTEEARVILEENPLSFLSVTNSAATFPVGIDEHDPKVYARAKENLDKFKKEKTIEYKTEVKKTNQHKSTKR